MANKSDFVRPLLPGERSGQEVRIATRETTKNALFGGSSVLPPDAIIEFPFDEPIVYEQNRQNSFSKNYFIGARVNGKDRCILVGTFNRIDQYGDGLPISPQTYEFASQFNNIFDFANALLGKKLKVVGAKQCNTVRWENGQPTNMMRTVSYPIIEFCDD